MAAMTIAQLARKAAVGVETVRYYQRRGLLEVPDRPASGGLGGIRRYGKNDLQRLQFIRSAQKAGFTLEEIGRLLDFDRVEDRPAIRALAEGRIGQLEGRIRELKQARRALVRLVDECGGGSRGPCPIIEAFDRP